MSQTVHTILIGGFSLTRHKLSQHAYTTQIGVHFDGFTTTVSQRRVVVIMHLLVILSSRYQVAYWPASRMTLYLWLMLFNNLCSIVVNEGSSNYPRSHSICTVDNT